MPTLVACLVLVALFLSGCGASSSTKVYDEALQRLVSHDDDLLARHFIESVRTGNFADASLMLAPEAVGDNTSEALAKLKPILDQGPPIEIKTIGYNRVSFHSLTNSSVRVDLDYQLQYKTGWVAGDVFIDEKEGGAQILGAHFHRISDSLENLFRFILTGQTISHYVILTLLILIPVFCLFALILCIRTPMRRKWLWIIFIVLAFPTFRYDWSSGRHDFQFFSAQLCGAACFQSSPYSPWVFKLGFPLGATIFLVRRQKLIRPSTAPR